MKAVIFALFFLSTQAWAEDPFLSLAKRSQCFTCHSIDHRMLGPSWNDISARYNGEIKAGRTTQQAVEDRLVDKVARGGKGNWDKTTGGMSMTPNYPRVSRENLRKLVQYILSLKKNG